MSASKDPQTLTKFLDAERLKGMIMTLRPTQRTHTNLLGKIVACSN